MGVERHDTQGLRGDGTSRALMEHKMTTPRDGSLGYRMSHEEQMGQLRLATRKITGPVSDNASDLYNAMTKGKPRVLYRTVDSRWALSGGWLEENARYWSETAVRELVDKRLIVAPWDAPRDSWYEVLRTPEIR